MVKEAARQFKLQFLAGTTCKLPSLTEDGLSKLKPKGDKPVFGPTVGRLADGRAGGWHDPPNRTIGQ